jgi:nucleotide-binding universal stress UspA family protein
MADIVVGVDGSESGARALRWAADEARRRGVPVTAVMAWGYLDQHNVDPKVAFDPTYDDVAARLAAEAAVSDAGITDLGVVVKIEPVCDLPAVALTSASADAGLLVVGSRGLGGFKGLLLGSVSDRCLARSACPVVVVPSIGAKRPAAATDRIVVGVDGSAGSRAALRWALDEGEVRGATVEVLHAWQVPFLGIEPIAASAIEPESFEQAAQELLDATLADVPPAGSPAPTVEQVLVSGPAPAALLGAATGADLVVLGGPPPTGLNRLTVGSVARQVIHHAPCPVVVVPAD